MHQPAVALRPAATLILLRDGEQGVETLMMQRTHKAAFVPGGYVFPGGALDADDADRFFAENSSGLTDAQASRLLGVKEGGLSYWVAAIRECFEEAGILLARDKQGGMVDGTGLNADTALGELRKKLAASEVTFAEYCRRNELEPAFDQLTYFTHWITPLGPPRRFDTRFFVAMAPQGQAPLHDDTETIAHAWIRPADAVARHRAGELDMMFATVWTLELLSRFPNVGSILDYARSVKEVTTFRPRVASSSKGRRVLVEGDHAYAEIGKLDPAGHGKVSCEIIPGSAVRLSDSVVRLTAPNPGFMTGPGTNSYLIEDGGEVAIIDPGPAMEEHVERLVETANGKIRWVLTTHTHMDHSPAAQLLKERTGAQLVGLPPPATQHQDRAFLPDKVLQDGERLGIGSLSLRAVHTPGHASNHVCYLLEQEQILFTGDHIMQGSTVVINPPDGNMLTYLASLAKIRELDVEYLAPGHGFLIDKPHAAIDALIAHRLRREQKVLAALRQLKRASLQALLPLAYDDVPEKAHAMALRSLLAHLEKLQADGCVAETGQEWELV